MPSGDKSLTRQLWAMWMAASTTTSETIDILLNMKSVHVCIERTSHKQCLPSWSVQFHTHSNMLDDTQVWSHFVEIQYLRHRTRYLRYNKALELHEYNSSPRPFAYHLPEPSNTLWHSYHPPQHFQHWGNECQNATLWLCQGCWMLLDDPADGSNWALPHNGLLQHLQYIMKIVLTTCI